MLLVLTLLLFPLQLQLLLPLPKPKKEKVWMSLFHLSKGFAEIGVDADSRGDEWMGWDLGWYWESKKYVIPLGVVALYENMCISFSLALSLLSFWSLRNLACGFRNPNHRHPNPSVYHISPY